MVKLTSEQREELEEIYDLLQKEYERTATQLNFTCDGCDDNCCDSYFQHHTYTEWLYFQEGLQRLDPLRRKEIEQRAINYLDLAKKATEGGERPQINCPLLEDGRCTLYKYRLLVCRTHGVPAQIIQPNKKRIMFPGCFRCQQIVNKNFEQIELSPFVKRTPFLLRLAKLEKSVLQEKRNMIHRVHKISLTIAEMILSKPTIL